MKKTILMLLFLLGFGGLSAQHVVSGTVVGDNGEALIGVNIIEKGTTTGTTTDIEGKYKLSVSSKDATLIFSYIGYTSEEMSVNGLSTVDVVMKEGTLLGEFQVVGSRSVARSAVESPVAVDVIDVALMASNNGKAELNQILQYAAPSFNATKQSGSDGADHIDPASLRGLGPDQTLVLINGKRRHQSSLVNVFGTRGRGNTGTDMNALPAFAIKRVEILRDGASAQYGSDAIAGVINIVLKDQTDGLSGGITYGAYSTNMGKGFEEEAGDVLYNIQGKNRIDGKERAFDGGTFKVDLNYGAKVGKKGGFFNVTTEILNKERTLRPSWSWRKGYGTAAVEGVNLMLNLSVPISDKTEFYAFGGHNFKHTNAYAFSRDSYADGDNRSVPSLYPNGFSPRITSNITDLSASTGIRHTSSSGWKLDFNNTFGRNRFQYNIQNTNNASMKSLSPTEFDAGGHSLIQNTTAFDASRFFKDKLAGINVAYGAEFRAEVFDIFAGDVSSYATYDQNGQPIVNPATQIVATDDRGDDLPGGSQGFPGYSPGNVVNASRSNMALYADVETNITKAFLLAGAVRFERYSDFGSTFNYKLASRLSISDNFSLRASMSSGFRAPSLAQIHYNLIFNNIVAGESVPSLLSANTSPITRAFGIGELKQETAFNTSVGFTFEKDGFSATVDAYSIAVNDRIVLTDPFDATSLDMGVEKAQFFANGVDTRTKGLDVVLMYGKSLGNGRKFTFGVAGNFNQLKIDKIHNGSLNQFTFFGPFSQAYLQAAAPKHKFVFNASYSTKKLDLMLSLTKFSSVILQDFQWVDSPATNQAEADALLAVATDLYKSNYTLDFSASYAISESMRFTIGANNILGRYPTAQFDGWTDQGGFSDSVQMGTDGTFLFGRLGFKF